MFTGTD